MSTKVQSLLRGLALLEVLADADADGVTLQYLCNETGLSPSTVHRLLATMTTAGYVARAEERGTYLLGTRIVSIARTSRHLTAHIRLLARPHLEALALSSGETAYLVALDGQKSVYVDEATASRVMRMTIAVGSTFPANTSASAKAILAFRSHDDALRTIFGDSSIRRYTRRTIVDAAHFREELNAVCARGYAVEREEVEEGVSCIAAPILGHHGRAIAAISIPGPTSRILNPDPERLGRLIQKYADRVTASLQAHCTIQPNSEED